MGNNFESKYTEEEKQKLYEDLFFASFHSKEENERNLKMLDEILEEEYLSGYVEDTTDFDLEWEKMIEEVDTYYLNKFDGIDLTDQTLIKEKYARLCKEKFGETVDYNDFYPFSRFIDY